MIKWIKRIILGFLSTITILILLLVVIKPKPYYIINCIIGNQIQWFGYDLEGKEMIDKSIKKIKNFSASGYHIYSIQNTKNGNYNKAIEYLDKASDLEPKEVDGYYGWLLLYYYRDYEKALFYLNRYDSFTPDFDDSVGDDNILYAKALCYKELGQYSKALELFDNAIKSELKEHGENWISHQVYFQKARTLHLLGQQKKAIEYYNKTIKLWNKSSESFYYKGLAQIEINDSLVGRKNLDIALDLVTKGYKTSDGYVALFDEVYQMEIEKTINQL
ncbi:tetratricopeptide repeat protein [Tenacibaculum piscium]|uniref:tetratricopeptide repeat protein n=1 Tax=Tenacibaculum piscium TaxID=1458515 RepID=UPI00187B77D0|nr:tetratricopeptide repeat protein [Tenacibaculum piscium]MBE7685634.1 tetratricopeptide repeat protein [Tenacibaculum piscium]MCG8183972.1 tetratricopeptide repeat protein [Tenacibaculum piscium]MCG8205365.1 tetratricopeptide repeat protein [Tenacibaculum piscium]